MKIIAILDDSIDAFEAGQICEWMLEQPWCHNVIIQNGCGGSCNNTCTAEPIVAED